MGSLQRQRHFNVKLNIFFARRFDLFILSRKPFAKNCQVHLEILPQEILMTVDGRLVAAISLSNHLEQVSLIVYIKPS